MKVVYCISMLLVFSLSDLRGQTLKEIGDHFESHRFDQALLQAENLLNKDSLNPTLNMIVGRSLAKTNRYFEAIKYLEKAIKFSPSENWIVGWSKADLAICYYMSGKLSESKKLLNEVIELNSTKNSVSYAEGFMKFFGFTDNFSTWHTDTSGYIIFYFEQPTKIKDTESYIQRRVDAYNQLMNDFPIKEERFIHFFVWSSSSNGKKILGREIGFADDRYWTAHSLYNQTPGHELAHIIINNHIKPKESNKFIFEGVATLYNFSGDNKIVEFITSIDKKNIDFKDVWQNPNNYDQKIIYLGGGAFMDYCKNNLSDIEFEFLLKYQNYTSLSPKQQTKMDSLIINLISLISTYDIISHLNYHLFEFHG